MSFLGHYLTTSEAVQVFNIYSAGSLHFQAMHPEYLVPQPAEIAARDNKAATRIKQTEYYDDYLKSIEAVTKHLREVESQDMSDALKDQIRQWFLECR